MRVAESKVSASAVKWRGATFTCPTKKIKNQVWRVKGDDWRSGVLVIPHSYCAKHDYFPFIFFGHMTILFEGDSTRVAEALQYIPFLLPTSFFQ